MPLNGGGWLNNSYTVASTNAYMFTLPVNYQFTTLETNQVRAVEELPPKVDTAVDWLRKRVQETCDLAFDGIAA